MRKYLFILALFSLVFFSHFQCEKKYCCGPYSEDCPAASTVLGGTWRLIAYQNVSTGKLETDPEADGRGVVLIFKEVDGIGQITGHTAANEVSGSYSRERCALKDVVFGGTKVVEPNAFNAKTWAAINGARKLTFTEDKLSIYFNNFSEVMLFEKAD